MLNPALLTPDALVHASVILAVGLLLLISSLSTIIIFCSNRNLHDVIGCYLVSLTPWPRHKVTTYDIEFAHQDLQ